MKDEKRGEQRSLNLFLECEEEGSSFSFSFLLIYLQSKTRLITVEIDIGDHIFDRLKQAPQDARVLDLRFQHCGEKKRRLE